MDVAVHDAGGVQRGDRLGDRVGDQGGPLGVERALAQHVAQRDAGHPLADQVGPVALVDGVVDGDQVRVDEPARGDGDGEHAGGGLAAGLADHQRDRPAQDRVDAAPDLAAGGVGVDVLLEAVPVDENLAGGRRAEGHHARHTRRPAGSGPTPVAFVAHPSSSSDPALAARRADSSSPTWSAAAASATSACVPATIAQVAERLPPWSPHRVTRPVTHARGHGAVALQGALLGPLRPAPIP